MMHGGTKLVYYLAVAYCIPRVGSDLSSQPQHGYRQTLNPLELKFTIKIHIMSSGYKKCACDVKRGTDFSPSGCA